MLAGKIDNMHWQCRSPSETLHCSNIDHYWFKVNQKNIIVNCSCLEAWGFSEETSLLIVKITDYRHPMKPFQQNLKLLDLGRQCGQKNFGTFGVFWANLSAPILVHWVPCPCFPLINHYFYKKISLYIQMPNNYLALGLEFGPQRIRDLAIVCP